MGTTTKHALSLSGYNTCEYCSANTKIVLLGNKKDHEDREVSTEEGHKLARIHRVKFYETSALTGENWDAMSETLSLRGECANTHSHLCLS